MGNEDKENMEGKPIVVVRRERGGVGVVEVLGERMRPHYYNDKMMNIYRNFLVLPEGEWTGMKNSSTEMRIVYNTPENRLAIYTIEEVGGNINERVVEPPKDSTLQHLIRCTSSKGARKYPWIVYILCEDHTVYRVNTTTGRFKTINHGWKEDVNLRATAIGCSSDGYSTRYLVGSVQPPDKFLGQVTYTLWSHSTATAHSSARGSITTTLPRQKELFGTFLT